VGAVADVSDGAVAEFYGTVDLQSCLNVGLGIDAGTWAWWMRQDQDARLAVLDGTRPLGVVLEEFAVWLESLPGEVHVWGNGSDFDNAILAECYRRLGRGLPWEYWNNRCLRSLVKVLGVSVKRDVFSLKHHALEDARHEMRLLQECLRVLAGRAAV
jgi:exodeoxyribonuclease VIII